MNKSNTFSRFVDKLVLDYLLRLTVSMELSPMNRTKFSTISFKYTAVLIRVYAKFTSQFLTQRLVELKLFALIFFSNYFLTFPFRYGTLF